MLFDNKLSMSKTDKLCLIAMAGILITTSLTYELTDGASIRAAEAVHEEKTVTITITHPTIDCTPIVEAIEDRREELLWDDVPLDRECQEALMAVCEDYGIAPCLALGLIEVESGFQPYAENGVSYGLCQLNKKYFPEGLTPEGNITCGIAYLGELLEKYDWDEAAALVAYNQGSYKGVVTDYAKAVLSASEKYGEG